MWVAGKEVHFIFHLKWKRVLVDQRKINGIEVALKRAFLDRKQADSCFLSTLTPDSASQLDVLGHDGHSLGVDSAQVSIFEKTNQVCFGCFLKSHDS